MKRSTLAAATVVALTAVGISAPAAVAGKSHAHGHSAHGTGSSAHGTGKLAKAQKKLQHQIDVKDRKLDGAEVRSVRKLGADDVAAVGANIAADQDALAALGEQLAAATGADDLRAIAAQVKAVRPELYNQAISGLVAVGDATALGDADIATAAAALTVLLHAVTATSEHADLQAIHEALSALASMVEAATAEPETDEEPGDEAPGDEEPTDPGTEEPGV